MGKRDADGPDASPRPSQQDRRPSRPLLWPLSAFVLASLAATAFFLYSRFFNDDALITIRYAENLVRGDGLVYNPGERVLGVTTPLWALILAAFGRAGLALPATATVLGVLAHGWAACMAVLLERARGAAPLAQGVAALLVATSPLLLRWAGSGMETSLYVAAIVTFLWLFQTERLVALGFLGGAMLLLRPDAGLFLAAGAVLGCVRARSLRPLVRVLPGFLIVTLPWFVGATLYYGSPLPNSGFAKRLQVADWGPFLVRFAGHLGPLLLVLPLALIGAWRRCGSAADALPVWCLLLFVLGMHFGSLPGCEWYMPPAMVLVLLLIAEGAGELRERLPLRGRAMAAVLSILVLAGADAHLLRVARAARRDQGLQERLQGAVGNELARVAPRGASVAVDNIGYIGYRSGLRVVDIMGLVSGGVVEHLAAGDLTYAIRERRPEYLAIWVGRGATPRYTPDATWLAENGYHVVFEVRVVPEKPAAYTIFAR